MKKMQFLLVILTGMITMKAGAHGVIVDIKMHSTAVTVRSSYSASQPLVAAAVTVFSPESPEAAWQTGETDINGNFAFVPDAEGDWVFFVDDQKGHKERVTIRIPGGLIGSDTATGEALTEESVTGTPTMRMAYKIITGLSLIFGITGILYGYRSKQTR